MTFSELFSLPGRRGQIKNLKCGILILSCPLILEVQFLNLALFDG